MHAMSDRRPVDGGDVSDSLIRIELITHFHCNPGLEGTCREVAESIGRDAARVESQMNKLVLLNILEERSRDGEKRYSYIPPFALSTAVEDATRRQDRRRGESRGDQPKPSGEA